MFASVAGCCELGGKNTGMQKKLSWCKKEGVCFG